MPVLQLRACSINLFGSLVNPSFANTSTLLRRYASSIASIFRDAADREVFDNPVTLNLTGDTTLAFNSLSEYLLGLPER